MITIFFKKSSNKKLMIAGDLEISLLKKRLEETEKAMERIVAQVVMLAMRMMKMLMVMLMVMLQLVQVWRK